MRIRVALRLALDGIRTNPMRAFLTSLGVVIGVAAVILIIAIGEGARAQVVSNIEGLGTNIIYVSGGSARPVLSSWQSAKLDNGVFADLTGRVAGLSDAAAELTAAGREVRYADKTASATVSGVTAGYMDVRNYKLISGRQFNEAETVGAQRVCMLSWDLADELFRGKQAIGSQVKLEGVSYRVTGVYQPSEAGFFRTMAGMGTYQALIPLSTAQKRLSGNDALSMVLLKVKDARDMDSAKLATERFLLSKMGYEENFNVMSQADMLSSLNTVTRTMTYLLASIAAISLVVGGIGIMNIMLVSVTERIREIGIRKALGAARGDILMQFLIEAVLISLAGGTVGTAAGWSLAAVVSKIAGWPSLVPWYSVALALAFSSAIGLFFGVYPANKAAALQPVEALRYE